MSNRRLNQFQYSFIRKPIWLQAKFTVASGNGAGVTPLAPVGSGTFGGPSAASATFGMGITSVLGFSSAPAAGNNVAAGNLFVGFGDPYLDLLGFAWGISSVVTGAAVLVTTGLVVGTIYQITTVGTTTTAGWQALGVPVGVTPAVGVPFVAATAVAGAGTGAVKALASSQVTNVELAGNAALTLNPSPAQAGSAFGAGAGGYLLFNLFKTTTLQQPTDGAIVTLDLWLRGD